MMLERDSVEYDGEEIIFETRRVASRKTMSIEVHPDMRIVVRGPGDCSNDVFRERVQKRMRWIQRQIAYFKQLQPRAPHRQYLSGETHLYLGRRYRLRIQTASNPSVKLAGGYLNVHVAKRATDEVQVRLEDWYRERAKRIFAEQLALALSELRTHGSDEPRLAVRAMQTRWGSMSASGLLTLNVSLIQAPLACIEYVIFHELCHLKVRNHGKQFHALLNKAMPDWQKRKLRLESVFS